MGMMSFEGVKSLDRALIQQFVEKYYQAIGFVKAKRYNDSKRAYSELLELLKQVGQRDALEEIHKQLAYNCVRDVYSQLSQMQDSPLTDKTFKALLSVTVIVLLIGLLLLLKPNLVGMFAVDIPKDSPSWVGGINTFTIDSIARFDLDDFFYSENEMGYSATESTGLDVLVANNILVVIPKPGFKGLAEISVFAFNKDNPEVYTKVPLKFIVN